MTWRAKSTSPATFSLKQAMSAMLSGDSTNGWLTEWMVWIPDQWFDSASFCAAGPPPTPENIDLADIISAITARKSGLAWTLIASSVVPKLQGIANDRVFGAYCEDYSPPPTGLGPCLPPNYAPDADWNVVPMPAGSTRLYVAGGHAGNVQSAYYWSSASIPTGSSVGSALSWDTSAPDIYIHNTLNSVDKWIAVRVNTFRPSCYAVEGGGPTIIDHTPTATPRNADVPAVPYATRTYTTIADLGAELDAQEAKLDQLQDGVRFIANALVAPTASAGTETSVSAGELKAIGDAHGVIVRCASIPAAVSEDFESPPRFRNLGHYTQHTADGPLQADELNHNPQVVMFLPMVTHFSVSPMPPATATLQLLYPTK